MEKIIELNKKLEALKGERERCECQKEDLSRRMSQIVEEIARTETSICQLPHQKIKKNLGINVELKAIGKNGSGKTRLLSMLKECLEDEGMDARLNKKDEHILVIHG